jgi:subtilisin
MRQQGIEVLGVYGGLRGYAFRATEENLNKVKADTATEVVGGFESGPASIPRPAQTTGFEPVWMTKPVVSGVPKAGQVLTTSNGTWDDGGSPITHYLYNWYVCANPTFNVDCTPIGVPSNQYLLRTEDVGFYMRSEVSACNAVGCGFPIKSEATGQVTGNPDPNASTQRLAFGITRVNARTSSARTGDGTGAVNVNVAVMDTGVTAHPDLNLVGGISFQTDDPACPASTDFSDLEGHGTTVSGVLAASDNTFGVAGVAPGARLWAVRVLDEHGGGKAQSFICGMDWLVGRLNDGDPSNDVRIVNFSAAGPTEDTRGCGTTTDALHLAICRARDAGILMVAAAGNDSINFGQVRTQTDGPRWPASWDEVLTVTATNDYDGVPGMGGAEICFSSTGESFGPDDRWAQYSNWAATGTSDVNHTIAAPGSCLTTTTRDGGYAYASGTSFSAPIVSGVVALCRTYSTCGTLTPSAIITKIRNDAQAFNEANYGHGFDGDPFRAVTGRFYGYQISANVY